MYVLNTEHMLRCGNRAGTAHKKSGLALLCARLCLTQRSLALHGSWARVWARLCHPRAGTGQVTNEQTEIFFFLLQGCWFPIVTNLSHLFEHIHFKGYRVFLFDSASTHSQRFLGFRVLLFFDPTSMKAYPPSTAPRWSNILQNPPPLKPQEGAIANCVFLKSCRFSKGILVTVFYANAIIQREEKLMSCADKHVLVLRVWRRCETHIHGIQNRRVPSRLGLCPE